MLSKLTSKNQITIPKKIIEQLPGVDHFDVNIQDGVIVMKPVVFYDTDMKKIRSKMKQLGINEDTVAEAIKWARKK